MPREHRSNDPYRIHYVEAICETENAEKYDFGVGEEKWIPKSLILDEDEDEEWIEIPEWLAYKEGLL